MCSEKTFTVRVSDHGPGTFVARGDYDGSGDGTRGVQIELSHEFAKLGAAGALFVSATEAARIAGAVWEAARATDRTFVSTWTDARAELRELGAWLEGAAGDVAAGRGEDAPLHAVLAERAEALTTYAGDARVSGRETSAAAASLLGAVAELVRERHPGSELADDYRAELERLTHALDAARKDLRQGEDQRAHARALQLAGEQLTARATDADVAGGAEARRAAGGLLLSVAEQLAELAEARATIDATAGNVRELTEQRDALRTRLRALNAEADASRAAAALARDAERAASEGNATLTEIVATVERELGEPLGALVDDDFAHEVRDLRQRAERAEQALARTRAALPADRLFAALNGDAPGRRDGEALELAMEALQDAVAPEDLARAVRAAGASVAALARDLYGEALAEYLLEPLAGPGRTALEELGLAALEQALCGSANVALDAEG